MIDQLLAGDAIAGFSTRTSSVPKTLGVSGT